MEKNKGKSLSCYILAASDAWLGKITWDSAHETGQVPVIFALYMLACVIVVALALKNLVEGVLLQIREDKRND